MQFNFSSIMEGFSSSDFPWMNSYLLVTGGIFIMEQYLNVRMLRKLKDKEVPKDLAEFTDEAEYKKSQEYSGELIRFSVVEDTVTSAVDGVSTFCFFAPAIWRYTSKAIASDSEFVQSLAFCGAMSLVTDIVATPLSLYKHFIIEEKYGFNKMTLMRYIKDKILSTLVTWTISAPILYVLIKIVNLEGSYMPLKLWAVVTSSTWGIMAVYFNTIAPLFNKYTPLPEGVLRTKINALCSKMDFPLTDICEMDGSTRSNHSNAFFAGLSKWKRLVLYDTLLKMENEQILAVVAHELGHWKNNHVKKMFAFSSAQLLVFFTLYGAVVKNDHVFDSFGFTDCRATLVGLILLSKLYAPINSIIHLLANSLSRKYEYEADEFAHSLGFNKEMQKALIHLRKDNLGMLQSDTLYSIYHHTHPTIVERVHHLRNLQKRDK